MNSCFVCRMEGKGLACMNCSGWLCKDCLDFYQLQVDSTSFQCPRCALTEMNPFCHLVQFLSEVIIDKSPLSGVGGFEIRLSDLEVENESMDFVEVRCMKLDSRGKMILAEQTWPDKFKLLCPYTNAVLTEAMPLKTNLSLKKRKDSHFALSCSNFQKFLRKNLHPNNRAMVMEYENVFDNRNSFSADAGKIFYLFVIAVVRKLSFEQFVQSPRVRQLGEEDSSEFVRGLLTQKNEDIVVAELKLDMLCPMTYTKVEYPGRGNNCRHLSCFSIKSFFLTLAQSEHRKVYCPICQKTIQFFYYDRHVEKIIQDSSPDLEQIVFNSLGEFTQKQVVQSKISKIEVMEMTESDREFSEQHFDHEETSRLLEKDENASSFLNELAFEVLQLCFKEHLSEQLEERLALFGS